MTSLTIQLDDKTNSRLLELSRREHKKPEAIAVDAVRRRLFVDWFEGMNDILSERAAKRGFTNEDDFLNAVS
jgi:predicted transcriptional regulator